MDHALAADAGDISDAQDGRAIYAGRVMSREEWDHASATFKYFSEMIVCNVGSNTHSSPSPSGCRHTPWHLPRGRVSDRRFSLRHIEGLAYNMGGHWHNL